MHPIPKLPILGVLIAITVTTIMDATGLSELSALPLFPLMLIFWYIERRLSRRDVGFVFGPGKYYGLAALHPPLVLGVLASIAAAAGAVDLSRTNWKKATLEFALAAIATIIVAMLTEEGFFRGWLWASLEAAGMTRTKVLIWTSITFSLWHLSTVLLNTGFDLPMTQVPVFLINVAILGATWGMLRELSGSVIVASVSHGIWNGIAYIFFGHGTKVGALGIKDTASLGPEVGTLGLVLNVIFLASLIWLWRSRVSKVWKLKTHY